MFREEIYPAPSARNVFAVEETFKQKPTAIPLELPLFPTQTYIMREVPNYVPIVAIVSIIGFFSLLAFLAFMRKS